MIFEAHRTTKMTVVCFQTLPDGHCSVSILLSFVSSLTMILKFIHTVTYKSASSHVNAYGALPLKYPHNLFIFLLLQFRFSTFSYLQTIYPPIQFSSFVIENEVAHCRKCTLSSGVDLIKFISNANCSSIWHPNSPSFSCLPRALIISPDYPSCTNPRRPKRKKPKLRNMGLEGWLRGGENWLPFQRPRVQVIAPAWQLTTIYSCL